ncbi:MAG: CoA activase [Deltaproteobacteria bacterium]|nr:CoA activase [Deltaproteobacteria bacterium]
MITAGIDCGAKNSKVVIVNDGLIIGKAFMTTGFHQDEAVEISLQKAVKSAGITIDDIGRIACTGSGKDTVRISDVKVNDLKAIGKGAHYVLQSARTVVDIGAEEVRVAKLDEDGNILDFSTNEKCAAGAGAFIEAMGRALEVPLDEMGPLALKSKKDIHINAQCVIFAESEVIGLIHANVEKNDICKAIHDSIANRIASMVRRVGINESVCILGGVGHNPGFREALRRELKLGEIFTPDAPEYGAAVGAAVVGAEQDGLTPLPVIPDLLKRH